MFILKVRWTDGVLGVAFAVRCPWFWDLGNLMFKLMLGLAEVPKVWGGASLDPAGGRAMSVEGQGCTLARRPGEGIPGTRNTTLAMLLPIAQPAPPPSPVDHFCRWYIPIPNHRIREPSPLHTGMCRDRIKHDFNILFPSHNYWLHFPYLYHLARMLLMRLFIPASQSPLQMSASTAAIRTHTWYISFVAADTEWDKINRKGTVAHHVINALRL